MKTLVLIDLSGIGHAIYHASTTEPNPNFVSTAIVAKIRALASGQPHVAVCIDTGKSFRNELDATYKANRPAQEAPLHHQIALAVETLNGDGFPVWGAKGFEADDVIATATARALSETYDAQVLVVSSDKDLCQLIGDRVQQKSVHDGSVKDAAAVLEKFGVPPSQMHDWLCLVGDSSDNVKGAKGIGPKRASELLKQYGSLEKLYAAMTESKDAAASLTPSVAASLAEFYDRWPTVAKLIALRDDVPIENFDAVFTPRVPVDTDPVTGEVFGDPIMDDINEAMPTVPYIAYDPKLGIPSPAARAEHAAAVQAISAHAPAASPSTAARQPADVDAAAFLRVAPNGGDLGHSFAPAPNDAHAPIRAVPVAEAGHVAPSDGGSGLVPVEFERQLEPRTMAHAVQLSQMMFQSRLFSQFGSQQAVLAILLSGREIGLSAMASLRAFHLVENKPSLSADLIRAMVLRSPHCEYFRCAERTAERATWVTKRRGDIDETRLAFTIEEGRAAWSRDDKSWAASNWAKRPANMVAKTASSMLARLVYPDVVMGLYDPSELEA